MLKSETKSVHRHHDGSIDTAYYQAVGRQQRSRQFCQMLGSVGVVFGDIWIAICRAALAKKPSELI